MAAALSASVDPGPFLPEQPRPDSLRLLWIEDDEYVGGYAQLFLPRFGIKVRLVVTAAEGLHAARQGWADLILLDLRLPDRHGLDLLKQFRRDGIRTAVVVLTGFPDAESQALASRLGAAAFVSKPLTGERLVQTIYSSVRPLFRKTSPIDPVQGPVPSPGSMPEVQLPNIHRVAVAIARVSRIDHDLKTVSQWAHEIGTSESRLKSWCHVIGVKPKSVLSFARGLRAHLMSNVLGVCPVDLLEFGSEATLHDFLNHIGDSQACYAPVSAGTYVAIQRFLSHRLLLEDLLRVIDRQ